MKATGEVLMVRKDNRRCAACLCVPAHAHAHASASAPACSLRTHGSSRYTNNTSSITYDLIPSLIDYTYIIRSYLTMLMCHSQSNITYMLI